MDNKDLRKKLGKLVSSENEDNWWRQDLFEKYTRQQIPPDLDIISPPPPEEENYNCFVYVLGLQSDTRFLGNEGWDFTRNLGKVFDEMINNKILESLHEPKTGSLVVYRADDNSISHVGILETGKIVISKWSWGPLLQHSILDVPDHYGNKVEFYDISQKARGFVIGKQSDNFTIKVFIENEASSNIKNLFNEDTLQYRKSVEVSANYPFPYGFLLDTKSGDGDNLDCFVLTKQPLKSRDTVDAEPIGMFEEIEDGEEDHKILATLPGETWDIDENLQQIFNDFSAKVFSHLPGKKKEIGRFLGKKDAMRLIEGTRRLSNYKNRKYKILPYDPNWSQQFAEHAKILKSIFACKAISIEHIGSTAVPGLAGKPTIDILIIVEDVSVTNELEKQMETAGYHVLGEYVTEGALLFVKESDNTRYCNIHVFQKDHPHVQEMLQLRDYFRTHHEVVNEYSKLKTDLAIKYPNDYGQYRKYKDEWMNSLKLKIKTEAGE